MTDREKIQKAFAALRRKGYFARMNYKCCNSCAWYELGHGGFMNMFMREDRPPEPKVVFYNNQANRSAFYKRNGFVSFETNAVRTDYLQSKIFLQWSGDGQEIAAALRKQGLKVEWNGEGAEAICLLP